MVFKLLTDIYDSTIACHLVKPNNFITRGHHLRLYKQHVHYDLRKYSFGNRIVSNWNGLPDNVITSNSVGIFENRLDKFWRDQAYYFDYTADLTGAGSRRQL